MEKIEEFIDKLEDNIRWWKRAMETDGFESDEEGELQENSVCANFAHTGSDGKMKSKIENCLYMQVAHCNKCGGQSGYNIVDGEKVCFDCGEPYEADFSVSKVESTITTTNSQDQEEENNFVYTVGTPILESTTTCSQDTPEERKSVCDKHHKEICEECMRNGSWTFEYTPEEINPYEKITKEYARAFAKDEEKEDIKRLREEVKDTPEEWVEKLWELIDVYRDSKDINSELEGIEEVNQYVKQLLDERETKAFNEGVKEMEDSEQIQADWDIEELGNIVDKIVKKLDKLNKKK